MVKNKEEFMLLQQIMTMRNIETNIKQSLKYEQENLESVETLRMTYERMLQDMRNKKNGKDKQRSSYDQTNYYDK